MKKQSTKKTANARGFTLRGDDTHPYVVDLSGAEVQAVAAAHLKKVNEMPAAFGRYVKANPKLGQRDLSASRDGYIKMMDDHLKRAKELLALVE